MLKNSKHANVCLAAVVVLLAGQYSRVSLDPKVVLSSTAPVQTTITSESPFLDPSIWYEGGVCFWLTDHMNSTSPRRLAVLFVVISASYFSSNFSAVSVLNTERAVLGYVDNILK